MRRLYARHDALLQKTGVPEGASGEFAIERYVVGEEAAKMHLLRCLINHYPHRAVPAGTYTRLVRNGGKIVMSDTPAELHDHHEPVIHARGHCLVNGLGLGIVAEAMLRKEEVESVTVVEVSADVIRLVGRYLEAKWGTDRLTIEHADALTFRPPKGCRFGVVWHDIWDDGCADNLPMMKTLHRRYGHKADWQGSWSRPAIDPNWRWR